MPQGRVLLLVGVAGQRVHALQGASRAARVQSAVQSAAQTAVFTERRLCVGLAPCGKGMFCRGACACTWLHSNTTESASHASALWLQVDNCLRKVYYPDLPGTAFFHVSARCKALSSLTACSCSRWRADIVDAPRLPVLSCAGAEPQGFVL